MWNFTDFFIFSVSGFVLKITLKLSFNEDTVKTMPLAYLAVSYLPLSLHLAEVLKAVEFVAVYVVADDKTL